MKSVAIAFATVLFAVGCGSDSAEPTAATGAATATGATGHTTESAAGAELPTPAVPAGNSQLRLVARRLVPISGKPVALRVHAEDEGAREQLYVTTLENGSVVELAPVPDGPWAATPVANAGAWPVAPELLAGQESDPGTSLVVPSRAETNVLAFALRAGASAFEYTWRKQSSSGLPESPRVVASGRMQALGGPCLFLATDRDRILWRAGTSEPVEQLPHNDALPCSAHVLRDGSGVVVGFQGSRRLQLFRPGESAPAWSLQLDGFPRDIDEFDLDGDGDLELAIAGGDRSLWVLGLGLEGGVAGWTAAGVEPVAVDVGAIPLSLEGRDLDGDGAVELAVLAQYDLAVQILGGWNRSGPTRRSRVHAGQTPADHALGDFDGDGFVDLAIANRDSNAVSLLRGRGNGSFEQARAAHVGPFPNALAAGDLDGDGAAEAVTLNSKDDTMSVVAGGEFALKQNIPMGAEPRGVRIAELNGDGHADVSCLVTTSAGTELRVCFGEAGGHLAAARPLTARAGAQEPLCARGVALLYGNWSGSSLELLVADASGNALVHARVLPGDEEGGVRSAHIERLSSIATAPGPNALASLQADGDSELEVGVAFAGERPGWALLDPIEAEGARFEEKLFLPTAQAAIDLAPADLDGDGREDIVVLVSALHSFSGVIQAFLATDEPYVFRPLEPVATGLQPHHVVAGDVDGDGRDEVFVSAQNSHVVNAYRLAAGGERLMRLHDIGAGRGVLDLDLADVDGDGDLDLLVANAFSDDVSWIENR